MPAPKTVVISLRVTKAQAAAIGKAANRARRTPGDWMRLAIEDKLALTRMPVSAPAQPAAAENGA